MEKQIVCKDCGVEFLFLEGEQRFFAGRGWADPTRCRACRAKKAGRDEKRAIRAAGASDAAKVN